jgi:hypothetical protein
MKDAYVIRPNQELPKEISNPLVEIEIIVPVKCPDCDYTVKIYYLILPDNHQETDITFYKNELRTEHIRTHGNHPKI